MSIPISATFLPITKNGDSGHRAAIEPRHEATSRFFEKGLNVMEVASVTDHKTLHMLKRCTHLSAGDLGARQE